MLYVCRYIKIYDPWETTCQWVFHRLLGIFYLCEVPFGQKNCFIFQVWLYIYIYIYIYIHIYIYVYIYHFKALVHEHTSVSVACSTFASAPLYINLLRLIFMAKPKSQIQQLRSAFTSTLRLFRSLCAMAGFVRSEKECV